MSAGHAEAPPPSLPSAAGAIRASGGCQCGAVRYVARLRPHTAHICHCRMCQKAAGNYFMPLANVMKDDFQVTRGTIAWFASSDPVRRGFCRDCGTPLVFETRAAPHLNVTLGSLDDPAAVPPVEQSGIEAKMPWFAGLDLLPGEATETDPGQPEGRVALIRASNRQHPDHDTETWP